MAVSVTELPLQIVADAGATEIESEPATVTVAVVRPGQPFVVPVMVYVSVAGGLAETLEPVDELRFVAGDQL